MMKYGFLCRRSAACCLLATYGGQDWLVWTSEEKGGRDNRDIENGRCVRDEDPGGGAD